MSGLDVVSTDLVSAAYDDFEAAGRETRARLEATERFRSSAEARVQAYATLAEARAMAYTWAIGHRTDVPRLHTQTSWHASTFALGQNCQDMRYATLLLDGSRTYRLRGRLGEQRLALWQVYSHVPGHPDSKEIATYDLTDMAGPDGTVDVVMSGGEQPEPWIRLEPTSPLNFVLLRRIFNRITDDPGELRIESLDPPALDVEEVDPGHMAERVHRAADLLRYLVDEWAIGLYDRYLKSAGGQKNSFGYVPGTETTDWGGSPSTTYGFLIYRLEPGEALIAEWDVVESAYWGWQLGDVWENALDFFNYQTSLNMDTAVVDDDGKVRVILSAEDPGLANWLDTRGRREGCLVLRNYKAKSASTAPTARKVRVADLQAELPAGTAAVTPEQRADALRQRRRLYYDAYGD